MSARQSLWIIAAALLFTVMSACVKEANNYMTVLEMVFYRSLGGCLLVAAIARCRRSTLRTGNFAAHCHRSLFGFLSLLLFFYALPRMSISLAQALLMTSPLFLVLLMSLLMHERLSPPLVIALLISFAGMLLVLKPFDAGWSPTAGGLAALGAGFTAGCAYYNIRRLGALQEGGIRTVFYFTLISTLLAASALPLPGSLSPFSPEKALWACALALTATLGQLALTRGLHYGRTLVSSALMYSGIVFGGILDYLLWDSLPDAVARLGICLIIGGSIAALRFARIKPA